MREHGSAAQAIEVLPDIARAAGAAAYQPCPESVAEAEWALGRQAGATPIAYGDPDYPTLLADIPDPPPILWARGDLSLIRRRTVALVGARNASSLGLRMARTLARGLGEAGAVTVSGFARGIDTAVHEATLGTGTIAVMAGGVDVVYPAENAVLAQDMAERGLCLSEQPMGLAPQARHFPRRNRLISGLARAVVVVEAATKSGSLITARDALDQGREVLAVPGHPFDARAAGCNMLIRDGATLIRGAKDVLEAIGTPEQPRPQRAMPEQAMSEPASLGTRSRAEPQAAPESRPEPEVRMLAGPQSLMTRILDRLGPSPTAEDELIRDVGRPAAEVAQALVILELDGRILRQPGSLLSRVET